MISSSSILASEEEIKIYKDARKFFDNYIFEYSDFSELVEILQYTYLFGTRCIGIVLREKIKNYGDS